MEKYLTVFLKTAVKIKDPESKRVIAELTGKGSCVSPTTGSSHSGSLLALTLLCFVLSLSL